MANVLVQDTSLTAIGEAIRGKNGETTLYKPAEMAAAIEAISSGGSGYVPTDKELTFSGDCNNLFKDGKFSWIIEPYGDRIKTESISSAAFMFNNCTKIESILFEINCVRGDYQLSLGSIFNNCNKLKNIPKINNCIPNNLNNIFKNCYNLRSLPSDFVDWFGWSYMENLTSNNMGQTIQVFDTCKSIRNIPVEIFNHMNKNLNYNRSYFNGGFYSCYALDELTNLPIPYTATWTSNAFQNTFSSCSRLKDLTFALQEDGTPCVKNWKNQIIDLSEKIGYETKSNDGIYNILHYNSGITADKEVYDDATYQALKNDPDWFTGKVEYSRYNHNSAVRTINSLPDTSAYLSTAGGTNTIKFEGASGSATDGGAINTMTEEEIAVATAKGWVVSFV